ncbi:hypothetical protein [Paenibacillus harenae]|uniref:hypothetical protein n=1 Tax=Paenibacillus harenae TaxID=306543 RepID=UPI000490BF81|nr:hypothetical protein [Paenibacillus harenae]
MDDQSLESSCQIIRSGEVIQIGAESVIIDVNGKLISVPLIKAEADLCPGDRVVWSGNLWRRMAPESAL